MVSKGRRSPDQLPLFTPDSDWEPPSQLPDLSQESEVAIDIETRDDSLAKDKGPGFYQYERTNPNTGFISGISAAWRDQSIYIPLRHYETECFDLDTIGRWLKSTAKQSHTRFVFHNFQYDWGWLGAVFGVRPPTLLDDTAAMASMINENLSDFSLDALCAWQDIPGKDETLLKQALAAYGGDGKKDLWRLPGRFVGPYGEQDALSTLWLAQILRPQITAENLDEAYQVERDLLPVTLAMKQRGIRVDIEHSIKTADQIFDQCKQALAELGNAIGQRISIDDLRRSRWLKEQFDNMHITPTYPLTAKSIHHPYGQPSFEKEFMANHPHWFPKACQKIKSRYDLADKFIHKFILAYVHKGRVYPSVNQFRSEAGGARSHRFSYSNPALQQMPSRDDEYAPLIRSCFIPEDGEEWASIDYRQQEYRLIVFVAEKHGCDGAKAAADRYRRDPNTDFHSYVAEITRLPRRRAKDVNFATSYGAGVAKFARMTGMDENEARQVMELYYKELPFVRQVSNLYSGFASTDGYIVMLDGARNHFNLWEPIYRDFAKEESYKKKDPNINTLPCEGREAKVRQKDPNHPWYYERMKRAYTHKAFNRIIQGTAARQIKKAMVLIDKAGYRILLQIHDELGFSFANRKHAYICAKIMEEAMPVITIPMLTDVKIGRSWGDLKK